ncbi:uncharacterized protein LOC110445916 [Mizuhopecten yessoensis]|uniref:Cyclic GMP-AMP synthase n=1 Tax=Mizuhopecten yessoensis TaxID=6573 RepID=A0A210QYR2_MIZYE|nr:uncharacterized protein LOC110445916 [Mizuhopecten yessoensis]OWF53835.1 Cyclic GMP-AMP synthase [Mizuhopecten yessoensis]
MADQAEQDEKSWILHHIMNSLIGSPEMVSVRRKLRLLTERIDNGKPAGTKRFYTGSVAEGMKMSESDFDLMFIDDNVMVTCPIQDPSIPPDSTDKTVCKMINAHRRPGYVTLQIVKLDRRCNTLIIDAIVPVGNKLFISSEMCRKNIADAVGSSTHMMMETHGPAVNLKNAQSKFRVDVDYVLSFPCTRWPKEANEWVKRPRLHGWPDKVLIDQIVQDGCHLVPVGDKTSDDTFLPWRISFATAERKLIHSLTHTQFLIYGLLKYFLKHTLSDSLKQIMGDEEIISSYIIKTVVFHAVENTPCSVWQEKNTLFCFAFCLKILIAWVNAGHCPNYIINSNNMFHGKVHGENQQKLLCVLVELHNMKLECLSQAKYIEPSIGKMIENERNGAQEYVRYTPTKTEMDCDMQIFAATFGIIAGSDSLPVSLTLLFKSNLDIDVIIAYIATARGLTSTGIETFNKPIPAKGNKEKYKNLRKSKILMTPLSSVCTSPGQLTLATYHYQTGNYTKTLELCGQMMSPLKIYFGEYSGSKKYMWYEHRYCGRGYTLLHKCQEVCASSIRFSQKTIQFWPSQLHPELAKINPRCVFSIPPLPYAVFLTFLCYHELGDIRRRDAALCHLRAVKYDEEQGGSQHWIVHNLVGICYEMVGDTRRAIREYRDSLGGQQPYQYRNPAMERIERLEHLEERQT